MKKSLLALLPAVALSFVSCDGNNAKQGETADQQGVWHGFAVDGKSGDRINFFNNDEDTENSKTDGASVNQIFAMVNGQLVAAKPCKVDGIDSDNTAFFQAGCFMVDGLPTATFIPVFAEHGDYHAFAGKIYVFPGPDSYFSGGNVQRYNSDDDDTESRYDPSSEFDISGPVFRDQPSIYANIKLFPQGVDYDMIMTTTYNNTAIGGVSVRCVMMTIKNEFDVMGNSVDNFNDDDDFAFEYDNDDDGNDTEGVLQTIRDNTNFLRPFSDLNPVLSGTSATEAGNGLQVGQLTFAGETLVKGATYNCYAHGESGDTVLYNDDWWFTVGTEDRHLSMSLSADNSNVTVVWNNSENNETPVGLNGPVTMVFNRPVQVVSGTTDCQEMSVAVGDSGADAAPSAVAADADDDDAESVTVGLSTDGYTMTIAPVYTTASTDDKDVTANFGGIFVQPTNGVDQATIFRVGNAPAATTAFDVDPPFNGGTCATVGDGTTVGNNDGDVQLVGAQNN